MARNHWLLVSTPENFEISRKRGFDLAAMKSRYVKKAQQVQPGDVIIFYLTRHMAIGGIAEVKSTYFASEEPIWHSEKPGETYPFRFQVAPELILPPGDYLPVEDWVHEMQHVRKWPPEHWRLAFQGNVHLIPEEDYRLIEEKLRARLEQVAGATRR
ncbi:MAG: EVE domain-containing protein [Dehalococcoidia bacterium]|nr:EVE domain-containing protein [Dehalococcoidia bacterium]